MILSPFNNPVRIMEVQPHGYVSGRFDVKKGNNNP